MKATIDGWRLAPSVGIGAVHSGAKPTIKVAKSPEVVWNGNPYCGPGCLLYLPGYPGSGAVIRDFSGQGNDGTMTDVTWTRRLSGLWVMNFNGTTSYVDCGASVLSGTSDFTIMIWFNATSIGDSEHILKIGEADVNKAISFYFTVTDDLKCGMHGGEETDGGVITAGTWYCVTLVGTNSGDLELFLNGDSVDTNTVGSFDIGATFTLLGKHQAGGFFHGKQSLARVVQAAYSAAQVKRLFQKERHFFGV